jgi:hypothetical protein
VNGKPKDQLRGVVRLFCSSVRRDTLHQITPQLLLHAKGRTMPRKTIELIHEGRYAAEVPIELIEDDTGWSPYLSLEDAQKLDAVRLALRRGEIAEAARHGRVFELTPISG